MVRRTTLVGITATGDAGVLLIPVLSGFCEGASPVSTSRLGQAFEHRLDAQAQTGLRYVETIQTDDRASHARFTLYPKLEVQ